jgi:hypothetical protein
MRRSFAHCADTIERKALADLTKINTSPVGGEAALERFPWEMLSVGRAVYFAP